MEKRLRSSLNSSADDFLSSATKSPFRSVKPSLKTLIHSLHPSSDVVSSLPFSLHNSILSSITLFKTLTSSTSPLSPVTNSHLTTPPTKRLRRSSRNQNDSVSGTVNEQTKHHKNKTDVTENLQVYTYVIHMCVTHPKNIFFVDDLLPAVKELHDHLVVFESEMNLLSDIACLCDEWWKRGFVGRDGLISQAIPFMLSKALTLKKKVDVHRVYGMRDAFALFDFEDESIEDLKLLLNRCLISPLFLKMDEGRRFLAFLFGLSRQLVKEFLAMIRSQVSFGRKSMLEAYADIVFRAWKGAEGGLRDEIVEFLQQLVDGSIHASCGSFAASIRRILGGFVIQRSVEGVEKLIFDLAEPVIFRSLQVANSDVRQNALHLLIDVFPLEDPDATREAKDPLLHKQFFLIEKLLMDDCPDIRAVAVEGSCRILHMFWETIPSSVITKLITKILDDMAHDVCNNVRLSTVNGIVYLLGNPLSHEILKVVLPRLGHLILDPTLSIRVAIVDLLLLIKGIQNFQFHKVVDLDVLLSTLAHDQPLVGHKITKLLLSSYFPTTVTPEEACNRCVTLINRSPLAGARFCEFCLSEGASPQSLSLLFKILINLILSPANISSDQIVGILMSAANICSNLATETKYKSALKDELTSKKLMSLFAAANSGRAQASVCSIVSNVLPDAAGVLRQECIKVVSKCVGLSDDKEKQAHVRLVHKMIMSCGWIDYMLEAFTKLLQKTADGCVDKGDTERTKDDTSSGKKRKVKHGAKASLKSNRMSGKKTSFIDDYKVSVGVAWQLKDLVKHSDTCKSVLESKSLESALNALKVISEFDIMECMQCDYINNSHVVVYTSLSLHMSVKNSTLSDKNNHDLKTLEKTVEHLVNCMEKAYNTSASRKSSKVTPCSITNMVKLSTSVLNFIIDLSTVDHTHECQERCLSFTRKYVGFIMLNLRQHSHGLLEFKEEDLKETFMCLKSSFTYAAKLLNLVLTSSSESRPPSPEAHNLANDLFDLVVSVEEHLGSRYGSLVFSAAKLWLPDLILALGSLQIQKPSSSSSSSSAFAETRFGFPSWLLTLAKIELFDQQESESDEIDENITLPSKFSTFRKVVETMVELLRGNQSVLDAVGAFLLSGSMVGLKKKDFELLYGVLRFVCMKLAKHEDGEWVDLKLMLESLQQVYPQMEAVAYELENGNEKKLLERARSWVEPIWRCYVHEEINKKMETDFSDLNMS